MIKQYIFNINIFNYENKLISIITKNMFALKFNIFFLIFKLSLKRYILFILCSVPYHNRKYKTVIN